MRVHVRAGVVLVIPVVAMLTVLAAGAVFVGVSAVTTPELNAPARICIVAGIGALVIFYAALGARIVLNCLQV